MAKMNIGLKKFNFQVTVSPKGVGNIEFNQFEIQSITLPRLETRKFLFFWERRVWTDLIIKRMVMPELPNWSLVLKDNSFDVLVSMMGEAEEATDKTLVPKGKLIARDCKIKKYSILKLDRMNSDTGVEIITIKVKTVAQVL